MYSHFDLELCDLDPVTLTFTITAVHAMIQNIIAHVYLWALAYIHILTLTRVTLTLTRGTLN